MSKTIVLMLAALALAGCEYGYTRSSFQQKVADKTLDEAILAAGQPARQETWSTGDTVLVYEKKTFLGHRVRPGNLNFETSGRSQLEVSAPLVGGATLIRILLHRVSYR